MARFLDKAGIDSLIRLLREQGYTVVGPTIDQGAIVYREVTAATELPRGWTDQQDAGTYRLIKRDDDAYFGYVVGPHSWKQFLFPPSTVVETAERGESGWEFRSAEQSPPRFAFLGVRACELAAMDV